MILLFAELVGAALVGAIVARLLPRRSSVAFREGWQKGVFEVLQAIQSRQREIQEGAVRASFEWMQTPAGMKGEKNPDPRVSRSMDMSLDELRDMAETVLRNPPERS